MTTTGRVTIVAATSVLVAALIGAIDCGGVSTDDVTSARNQATTASCNYYQMCNQIGPGLAGGATLADCKSTVYGQWTMGWPTTTCQGHVDQAKLTICLDAIGATTDCSGVGALFALSKCSSASVCSSGVVPPPDAATD